MARARNGKWNGSIPFGYCRGDCSVCKDPNGPGYCPYVGQPNRSDDDLILHPIESVAVKLAFALYADGNHSLADIATRFNQETFTLPDGTTVPFRSKGRTPATCGPLSVDTIRNILIRRFYTGVIAYYGVDDNGQKRRREDISEWYPGRHPILIEEALFEKVQQTRELSSKRYHTAEGKHPITAHPLSGLLVCASCGRRFRALSTGEGYRYYRDSSRIEKVGGCNQATIKAEEIEAQIEEFMRECQRWLPADWRERLEAQWVDQSPELAGRIQQAKARQERAVELYLEGLIDQKRVQECKLAYQIELTQLRPQNSDAIIALGGVLERFDSLWAEASLTTKNELLRLALEAAHIKHKSLVAIRLKVTFLPIFAICQSGSDGYRSLSDKLTLIPPSFKKTSNK
jgi:hypothetical protein